MTPAAGDPVVHEVPLDELYDANAEYYDLITRARVAGLVAAVDPWVADLPRPPHPPILDIGAGTGQLTRHLARRTAPRPVIAIEPSRGLRAVLVNRIHDADLDRQVTVLPVPIEAAVPHLPDQIGGAVAFGVLPHLSPDRRGRLLDLLARRLAPGASALVETMRPHSAEAIPLTPAGSQQVGSHRVECWMMAEPVGPATLGWTMTYRRSDAAGAVLHEVAAASTGWVVDPDTVSAEATTRGLTATLVTEDILQLTR